MRFPLGFAPLAALLLVPSATSCQGPAPTLDRGLLDESAITSFWSIQDQLMAGESVAESSWDTLFSTAAFQWQAPNEAIRVRIRDRMLIAFDKSPIPLQEALGSAEGYDVIRWNHYRRMREGRQELGQYLLDLQGSDILESSLDQAQQHLPEGEVDLASWSTPVRLLFFAPDALTDSGVVYLDLLEAADRGEDLSLLLGHEFHHAFYQARNPHSSRPEDSKHYWINLAVTKMHMEGLADRIDKRQYPLGEIPGGQPGYEDEFNRHYANAQLTLESFDQAVARAATADPQDQQSAELEAWGLLHFSGHVEGFYMVNTVADALGAAVLLEDIGAPFDFIRKFQDVRPTFSPDSMRYLEDVESQLDLELTADCRSQ